MDRIYSVSGWLVNTPYQFGETSFTDGIRREISLINYDEKGKDNQIAAHRDFDKTRRLKSEFVLELHFINNKGTSSVVVADRFDYTLCTWMERKKKLYKQLPKQEQNWHNWWSSIESEFRVIFSDVCNGLKLLFNRDFVHGNLINDGVVITRNVTSEIINTIENTMCGFIQEFDFGEGRALITRLEIREEIRAKLLLSRAGDGFSLRGATKDIQDLHLLMMDVLTVSGDISKHTVRAGLPKALELILGSLDNITPNSFQHFLRILVGLCCALVLT